MAEERDMVSKIETLPQQAKEGALEKGGSRVRRG